ncbi:hypothetical protein LZC95_19720 [Pendulispora brunnea]|uniref:Uncharacterized protein n=1 Tax=Pendulispora brunnea TaxID=2905690 RepID=A0ABZ2KMY4_9BACT
MSFLRCAGTDHEPRAVRRLVNGWYWHSASEPPHAVVAFAAACRCGWQSPVERTGTHADAASVFAEWCEGHLRPLVQPFAAHAAALEPAALSVALKLALPGDADGARAFVDAVALAALSAAIERTLEGRIKELLEAGLPWRTVAAALEVDEEAARARFEPTRREDNAAADRRNEPEGPRSNFI